MTDLLKGQLATTAFLNANSATAQTDANTQLATVTGKPLKAPELATAWADMTFTNDPIASSILTDLVHAKAAGFQTPNIAGIFDLGPINQVLPAAGKPPSRRHDRRGRRSTAGSFGAPRSPSAGVSKRYGDAATGGRCPPGRLARRQARRVPLPGGGFRVRQDNAAQPGRRPRPADRGHRRRPPCPDGSTARSWRPTAPTAMLFQDSALFPWLTVAANVELPLRLRGVGKAERRSVAADLLERVHLGGFGAKRPHELSGGMRQRVALARALAQDAGLLLMDEPFGALDAITRDLLHDELEALWLDAGFTVLFVTHNVREAARLGDRIVLLTSRPGRVAATFAVDWPGPDGSIRRRSRPWRPR